jgi:hypothetical protein
MTETMTPVQREIALAFIAGVSQCGKWITDDIAPSGPQLAETAKTYAKSILSQSQEGK